MDWQRDYEEIRAELTSRWQYRKGGRPYPTELTNADEIIQTLERMVPLLQRQINEELKEQAVAAMQQIATTYREHLTNATQRTDSGEQSEDMPLTPSEVLLNQVRIMQRWAQKDAAKQRHLRWWMSAHKYCENNCPYPDTCGDSKHRDQCLLKQLSYVIEAPWWKKLTGRRFVPASSYTESEHFALKKIRQSMYYSQNDEARLQRIYSHACRYDPELCQHWVRELLGRVDDRCQICRKRPNELADLQRNA